MTSKSIPGAEASSHRGTPTITGYYSAAGGVGFASGVGFCQPDSELARTVEDGNETPSRRVCSGDQRKPRIGTAQPINPRPFVSNYYSTV